LDRGQTVDVQNGLLIENVLTAERRHAALRKFDVVLGAVSSQNFVWIFGKRDLKDKVVKIDENLKTVEYSPRLGLSEPLRIEHKTWLGKTTFYCTDGKNPPFVWREGEETSEPLFFRPPKPTISEVEILENSGQIVCGVYRFCARSTTKENVRSEWSPLSDFAVVLRSEKEGGHEETFKSIRFAVENFDPQYEFLEIGVVRYDPATLSVLFDSVAKVVAKGRKKVYVVYDGKTLKPSTIDDLLFTSMSYVSAKALKAKDNRLFLANLSAASYPDCQKIADRVVVKHRVVGKTFDFYKSADSMSRRTYKSGETYSFCFIPIYKDGTEGRAYPIPYKPEDTLEKYESLHTRPDTGEKMTFHRIPKYPFVHGGGINVVELTFEVEAAIEASGLKPFLSGYVIGRQNRDKVGNVSKAAQGILFFGGRYVDNDRKFIAFGPGFGPVDVSVINASRQAEYEEDEDLFHPNTASDTVGNFFAADDLRYLSPICGFQSPDFLMRSVRWKPSEIEKVCVVQCAGESKVHFSDRQNKKVAAVDFFFSRLDVDAEWIDGKLPLKEIFPKVETSDLSGELRFLYSSSGKQIYVHKHSELSILDLGEVDNDVRKFFSQLPGYEIRPKIRFFPNRVSYPLTGRFSDVELYNDFRFPYCFVYVVDLNVPNLYQYGDWNSAEFFPVYVSKDLKNAKGVLGGDTYVSPFSLRHTGVFDYRRYDADSGQKFQVPSVKYDDFGAVINGMTVVYLESSVNGWWRMRFKDPETSSFLPATAFHPLSSKEDIFKIPVVLHKGNYYNAQYSAELFDRPYYPRPAASEDVVRFPQRIVYSDFQGLGVFEDAWRSFSPTSYQDIAPETGEITALAVFDSVMIALTEFGGYRLYTSEKERSENAILATVPILNLLPEMLGSGQGAFSGCVDPYSVVETPAGVFWYNRHGKKFHSYSYVTVGEGLVKLMVSDISQGIKILARNPPKTPVYAAVDFRNSRVIFGMEKFSVSLEYRLGTWISEHSFVVSSPSASLENLFFYGHRGALWANKPTNQAYPFSVTVPFFKDFLFSKVFDAAEFLSDVPFDWFRVETENQSGEKIPLVVFEEGKELESNCRFLNDHWQFKLKLTEEFELDLNYRPKGKYVLITLGNFGKPCVLRYVACLYRLSLR
jgi:hypothetical protein